MNIDIFLFGVNLFVYVLCAAFFMIIPMLTRKSLLFGVRIPPEEASCKEAASMKKHYMLSCLTGSALILIICVLQFIFFPQLTLAATLYLPLFLIPVYLAAFIPNWKKAVRLKEEKNWAVSGAVFAETKSSHTRGDLSLVPFVWYALGFIVILITFVLSVIQYPLLPDIIPVHFNAGMQPDGWAQKSVWSAFMMPLFNIGFLVLMFLVSIAIIRAKLQLDPNNVRVSFAQHQVYRKRMGHAIGFMTLTLNIFFAITNLLILYPDDPVWMLGGGRYFSYLVIAFMLIMIMPVIIIYITTGQGGCKVKIKPEDIENQNPDEIDLSKTKVQGRGDDRFWLLGLFYYNPEDPAVIVEARFGTKLNFNYAHLPVKIAVVIFLIAFIAMYVWCTRLLL